MKTDWRYICMVAVWALGIYWKCAEEGRQKRPFLSFALKDHCSRGPSQLLSRCLWSALANEYISSLVPSHGAMLHTESKGVLESSRQPNIQNKGEQSLLPVKNEGPQTVWHYSTGPELISRHIYIYTHPKAFTNRPKETVAKCLQNTMYYFLFLLSVYLYFLQESSYFPNQNFFPTDTDFHENTICVGQRGPWELTRCFSNKGRTQSFYFQGFPGLLYFSFVFLEMWEWPPAQRNDLGFKFEILAQYECLKRGIAFENTRWNAALFFVDTWCTHQITCERRIVATSPRDPSASTSCKKHFWPPSSVRKLQQP